VLKKQVTSYTYALDCAATGTSTIGNKSFTFGVKRKLDYIHEEVKSALNSFMLYATHFQNSLRPRVYIKPKHQNIKNYNPFYIFLLTSESRPALRPTQPPVQWEPGSFPRGKARPGRGDDHSHLSSAEVRNE
jgi:hypothetical protein